MSKRNPTPNRADLIAEIARRELAIQTLESEFHVLISVAAIKPALEAAYEAGYGAATLARK